MSITGPFGFIRRDKPTLGGFAPLWQGAFLLFFLALAPSLEASADRWSQTDPALNLGHIFEGEINHRGRAVGFHVRPLGQDPKGARLIKQLSGPNRVGVYTGRGEIFDEKNKVWKEKRFSSFFPDHLTATEIIDDILKAYHGSTPDPRGQWRAPGGHGFVIEGWLCPKGGRPTCPDGAINTAYPVYQKDEK